MEKLTDYVIESKPVSITFICPHCDDRQIIDVDEILESIWELHSIICPECGEEVLLGDFKYD